MAVCCCCRRGSACRYNMSRKRAAHLFVPLPNPGEIYNRLAERQPPKIPNRKLVALLVSSNCMYNYFLCCYSVTIDIKIIMYRNIAK